MDITTELDRSAEMMEKHGVRSLYRFVLDHGDIYEGAPLRRGVKPAEPRQCFTNALELAIAHDWVYVEGYAMRADLGILFHHAWCVTDLDDRTAIDPTWSDPQDAQYFGIQFQMEWLVTLPYTGMALEEYAEAWIREEEEAEENLVP